MNDICNQEGAFLIHTSDVHEKYHLEQTSAGKIRKGPVDENNRTRSENGLKFTRQVRKVQEQSHAGFKQMCKILNDLHLQASYFIPLTKQLTRKYGLPQAYENMPRLTVIGVVACDLYNNHHPGFRQRYLRPEEEVPAAQRFINRLFMENVLLYEGIFNIDFSSSRSRGVWRETTFAVLGGPNDPIQFPQLPPHQYQAAIELCSGPHALERANSVLTYITQLYIKENRISGQAALDLLSRFPDFHKIEFCDIDVCPPNWDSTKFGNWPGPIRFVRTLTPPSYRSATSRQNYHYVVIGFTLSGQPANRFGHLPPFESFFCSNCFGCQSKLGSMGLDRHGAALLKALCAKYDFKSTARNFAALSTVQNVDRQSLVAMPPIGNSQDMNANVPRRSRDWRHLPGAQASASRSPIPVTTAPQMLSAIVPASSSNLSTSSSPLPVSSQAPVTLSSPAPVPVTSQASIPAAPAPSQSSQVPPSSVVPTVSSSQPQTGSSGVHPVHSVPTSSQSIGSTSHTFVDLSIFFYICSFFLIACHSVKKNNHWIF